MNGVKRLAGAAFGVLLLAGVAQAAQKPAQKPAPSAEARTAARFEAVVGNRAQLRLFLRAMPKGGDLHNHLWARPMPRTSWPGPTPTACA
jgi:adenosine deaminase